MPPGKLHALPVPCLPDPLPKSPGKLRPPWTSARGPTCWTGSGSDAVRPCRSPTPRASWRSSPRRSRAATAAASSTATSSPTTRLVLFLSISETPLRLSFNQSVEHSRFKGIAATEAMGRPRPKRGEWRIDAAIDHLAQYGFAKPQIRKIINNLLQLYGRDGWLFLEEGSYRVVLDKLLEEQVQQDQKQEAAAAEEASPQNGMDVPQVHDEALNKSQSALELQASPNSSPPLECVLPLPPAKGPPRARPPCYGWISEESGSESEPENGEILSNVEKHVVLTKKDIPNPVETLSSKRKRPSRWDVHPN